METVVEEESHESFTSQRKRKRKHVPIQVDGTEPKRKPLFPPLESGREAVTQFRSVPVPPNRFTPLKSSWIKIFTPIVEHLHLQIRLNLKTKHVEIRTSSHTADVSAIQKATEFVKAFMLGFEAEDALALVRLEELYVESFEVSDVKPLKGGHLSRAIGRVAGTGGRTKYTIENVTKTRIVLADSKVHILGSFHNIRAARNAICSLILGTPPSKVYGQMKSLASRASERF